MASYDQKSVKKSMYWSRHGKHAKIDPALITREHKSRDRTTYVGSIQELFSKKKGKK